MQPQQQQVVFVNQPARAEPVQISATPHKVLSIIELIIVPVAVVMEIAAIVMQTLYLGRGGIGIWFGFWLFWPGLFGLLTVCKRNKCLETACLVFAILAAMTSGVAMIFYGVAWGLSNVSILGYETQNYGVNNVLRSYGFNVGCKDCLEYIRAKNALGLFLALIAFVVTIVHAAFCCKDICSCCNKNQNAGTAYIQNQPVSYPQNTYPQQPATSVPVQQQQAYYNTGGQQPPGYEVNQGYTKDGHM